MTAITCLRTKRHVIDQIRHVTETTDHVVKTTHHVIAHSLGAFRSKKTCLNLTYLECDFPVSEGNAARGRVIAEPAQSVQQRAQIGFANASE